MKEKESKIRMKDFKRFFLIIISGFIVLIFNTLQVKGQEMFGVGLSNYSGVMSTLYNPAMLTNSRNFLDIHLVTADVFSRNNMYYIPSSDYSIYQAIGLKPLPKYGSDSVNAKIYNDKNSKFVQVSLRALGPSASFQYGDHGFALTTGVRFFTSGNNIPWEVPVIAYIGIKNDSLHNINFRDYNIDLNTSAWMEAGLSYAYNVFKYFDRQLTVGVTVRKLWGYAGLTLAADNVDYIIVNDSILNIKNMNSSLGMSLPVDYDQNTLNHTPFFKGSGLGVDVGVVYVKKKKGYSRWDKYSLCSQPYEDYDYRIGVSVLDIGSINFKNNARYDSFDNVGTYWQNFDTLGYSNVNDLMGTISSVFYGSPDASLKDTKFRIGLPAAVSVQADFHTMKNIYVAAFWLHPLRINMHTIRRPAQLAVVPRYETRYFEVSVPMSIYDYRYPRVGFSARLWFLTVGTERIGTWLGLSDLNGLDIYASVKFNIGEKGHCKSRRMNACQNGEYGYSAKQRRAFRKHRR